MSTTVKSVFIKTRITKTINYKFGSFSEMLDFLMSDNRFNKETTRSIEYHEKKVRGGQKHKRNGKLSFDVEKDDNGKYVPSWFGKKSHSCLLLFSDKDGNFLTCENLFPFFDKNDKPLDQSFAAAFHLEDFVGVEVEEVEKEETHRSASYRWETL